MKKKYILPLIIIGITGLFYACSSVKQENPKTLLWEVKSANNTVYILGSIHLASDDFYPLNPEIEKAFKNSDFLGVEFDITKADASKLFKFAFYQDGKNLKSELDSATYAQLKEKLVSLGIPEMMILRMKPWFAAISAQITEIKNMGFSEEKGIDQYFLSKANAEKKEIVELESLEEQLQVFEEIEKYSNDFVKSTLKSLEDTVSNQSQIIDAYKKADIVFLEKYLNEGNDDEATKQINFLMNENRNNKMIKKIENYLTGKRNYFVVVGAGHLIGEKGLIEMLAKKNLYQIKRY